MSATKYLKLGTKHDFSSSRNNSHQTYAYSVRILFWTQITEHFSLPMATSVFSLFTYIYICVCVCVKKN